jgi:hypothetical protein
MFTLLPRPAEPGRSQGCAVFQWVGQSFEHCDACGRPEREHLYHPPYGDSRPLFYVKRYRKWSRDWVWQPVGSFVRER